jgi:hypothetical protein
MDRQSVVTRYARLRAISKQVNNEALDRISLPSMMEAARRLGMAAGRTLICDSDEEEALIYDLAVHDRRPGRSGAIDRYIKSARLPPGSDEARVAEAMRVARFSIWRFDRRHDVAGTVVTDLVGGAETWLMDQNMAASVKPGCVFAARLCWPEAFAMTCGIIVPIDREMMEEALEMMILPRSGARLASLDDPRIIVAIYRAAVELGVMERVRYRDPALAA